VELVCAGGGEPSGLFGFAGASRGGRWDGGYRYAGVEELGEGRNSDLVTHYLVDQVGGMPLGLWFIENQAMLMYAAKPGTPMPTLPDEAQPTAPTNRPEH
jgi:hypothetical protein